jgi:hypothetical protein
MRSLAALATLAFVVVSWLVGMRLVRLARRTHGVPELALGVGFLGVGAVGYPLGLLAVMPGLAEPLARSLFALSQLMTGVGSAAIFVFTQSVFRPEARWARAVVLCAALVLAVQTAFGVARGLAGDVTQLALPDLGFSVRQGVTAFSYGWTALEALRYRGLLVRRLALGLAEAEVVNRFLLWAIAGVGAFAGSATMSAVSLGGGLPWEDPLALAAVGLGGVVAAICTALAFLPPRAYLAWVRARG